MKLQKRSCGTCASDGNYIAQREAEGNHVTHFKLYVTNWREIVYCPAPLARRSPSRFLELLAACCDHRYQILQHSDRNGTLGLFPAWPCGNWSVSFKLHAPKRTVIEGEYDHTTGALKLRVEPETRRADLKIMGCAKSVQPL